MTFFYGFDDEKHQKNQHSHVPFMLSDIILAQWQRPVTSSSSEALDLLHRAMRTVKYWHIAMGMVHTNVGQKLLKRNIFKSFYRVSKLRSSR